MEKQPMQSNQPIIFLPDVYNQSIPQQTNYFQETVSIDHPPQSNKKNDHQNRNESQSQNQKEFSFKDKFFSIVYKARQIRTRPAYHKLYFILTVIYSLSIIFVSPDPASKINQISLTVEQIIQFCFLGTVVLRLISLDSIHMGWCTCQFLCIISGTACLFITNSTAMRYLKAMRCLRILLFVRISLPLYQPFNQFIQGFRNVQKIIIPAIVLIYLYSLIGLFLFKGNVYNRCRHPDNLQKLSNWTYYQQAQYLCGQRQCPIIDNIQLECLNPLDYDVQVNEEQNININMGYGLLNYNHIGYAFFNTFKMIFMTGWSRIVVLMKQQFNEQLTLIYYLTFLLMVPMVYMNIFYGFLIRNEQQNNEKRKRISLELLQNDNNELKKSKLSIKVEQKAQIILESSENAIEDRQKYNFSKQILQNTLILIKSKRNTQEHDQKRQMIQIQQINTLNQQQEPKLQSSLKTNSNQKQVISILSRDYYMPTNLQTRRKINRFLQIYSYFNNSMIVLSCLVTTLEWQGESKEWVFIRNWLDLIFLIQFIIHINGYIIIHLYKEIYLENWSKSNNIELKRNYNKLSKQFIFQIILLTISVTGILRELFDHSSFQALLQPQIKSARIFRCFKYLRIFIFLSHQNYSVDIKLSIICVIKSIKKIKSYLLFYLVMLTVFSLIGFNLFHENTSQVNQFSFNNVYQSFFMTLMPFYNQEWDYFMFMLYPKEGLIIVIYQLIVVTIGSIILSKYFMALVMNYLSEQLSNQQKISQNTGIRDQYQTENNRIRPQQSKMQESKKNSEDLTNKINLIQIQENQYNESKNQNQANNNYQQYQAQDTFKYRVCKAIKQFYLSKKYVIVFSIIIFFQILDLAHRTPRINPQSSTFATWSILQMAMAVLSILDLIGWLLTLGINSEQTSYLRITKFNYFDLLCIIIASTSLIAPRNHYLYQIRKIKLFRSFKILKLFSFHNNSLKILITCYTKLIPKLIKFLSIILIFYGFFACILVRIYAGQFYSCVNYVDTAIIRTKADCFEWGGDWILSAMNTDNFPNALLYTFMIASTEGWSSLMFQMSNIKDYNRQPQINANPHARIFFMIFFFLGNMIILNIFIGHCILIIKKIQNQVTGSEKLQDHEKEWILIKKHIHQIKLYKKIKIIPGSFGDYCRLISNLKYYSYIRTFIILSYVILISCLNTKSQFFSRRNLIKATYIYVFISFINSIIQVGGRTKPIKLQNKIIYTIFIVYSLIVSIILLGSFVEVDSQTQIFLQTSLVCNLLFRYWLYIYQFNYIKKVMHFLQIILPRSFLTIFIMLIVLNIYIIIGMNIFSFLKPNYQLNEFDQNYTTYYKSLFALIKFSSWQAPIDQIINASQQLAPNFICFQIYTYDQFMEYGQNGCGSKLAAYLFFITFHIIYSMILLSSLTANIYDSYCQVERQKTISQKQVQLHNFTKQWLQIDQKGTGYLMYNDFWRFVSRLHKIYTLSKQKNISIQNKEKFLKKLDLPVHEIDGNLCFYFYDTIQKFTSLMLTQKYRKRISVRKATEVFSKLSQNACNQNQVPKTNLTHFRSHQQGLRIWKKRIYGTSKINIFRHILHKNQKFMLKQQDYDQEGLT